MPSEGPSADHDESPSLFVGHQEMDEGIVQCKSDVDEILKELEKYEDRSGKRLRRARCMLTQMQDEMAEKCAIIRRFNREANEERHQRLHAEDKIGQLREELASLKAHHDCEHSKRAELEECLHGRDGHMKWHHSKSTSLKDKLNELTGQVRHLEETNWRLKREKDEANIQLRLSMPSKEMPQEGISTVQRFQYESRIENLETECENLRRKLREGQDRENGCLEQKSRLKRILAEAEARLHGETATGQGTVDALRAQMANSEELLHQMAHEKESLLNRNHVLQDELDHTLESMLGLQDNLRSCQWRLRVYRRRFKAKMDEYRRQLSAARRAVARYEEEDDEHSPGFVIQHGSSQQSGRVFREFDANQGFATGKDISIPIPRDATNVYVTVRA